MTSFNPSTKPHFIVEPKEAETAVVENYQTEEAADKPVKQPKQSKTQPKPEEAPKEPKNAPKPQIKSIVSHMPEKTAPANNDGILRIKH